MHRITSVDFSRHLGERVRLSGWLHRLRAVGQVSFLVLRDGWGTAQAVLTPDAAADASRLYAESVIEVEGLVAREQQAPGGYELKDAALRVISRAVQPPPLDLFRPNIRASLPTMLDHAAVALRHPRERAKHRISAAATAGFRSALTARGFLEVHTPKIVASATESGADLFEVDYFGRTAYLAQSPQLYKQTLVGVFERVFEVGPVFRAEPHDTTRHINEYVSLDAEMGFIEDHRTVMAMVNAVVRQMVRHVAEHEEAAIRLLGSRLPEVPAEIPVVHFREAQDIVREQTGKDISDEPDLSAAHEQVLTAWSQKATGSEFLFVEGYPMRKRPFYTHTDPARPEYSRGFDLLFRGWEIVTGGQRLHVYDEYLCALDHAGQTAADYEGYLEAFRHGMPPHGGFALGLERFVARLLGSDNLRETTLFPRDMKRLTP